MKVKIEIDNTSFTVSGDNRKIKTYSGEKLSITQLVDLLKKLGHQVSEEIVEDY